MRIWCLLSFLFISFGVKAEAHCRTLNSLREEFTVCWNDTHKGWFSKNCDSGKCEAISFLALAKKTKLKKIQPDSKNPSVRFCHEKQIPIEILRDKEGNEQSYCLFPDKSLVDSNTVEGVMP